MPYDIRDVSICENCTFGYCVTYIGDRSFKDRSTLYRIIQNHALACGFEDFIPGFTGQVSSDELLSSFSKRLIDNSRRAGKHLEGLNPSHFGSVRAPFELTSGQIGKVSGDVFQMLVQAILWNTAAYINKSYNGEDISVLKNVPIELIGVNAPYPIAILTLGDRYDLKKLLVSEEAEQILKFERLLADQGTKLSYSTPDLICIDLSEMEPRIRQHFCEPVQNLAGLAQATLNGARLVLEGKVSARQVVFAAGLKTSLRSDRLFQFLFEANAWKFIWRKILNQEQNSRYYAIATQEFGADPSRLRSVEFTSVDKGVTYAERAIDEARLITTPRELIHWFVEVLKPEQESDNSTQPSLFSSLIRNNL